MTHSSDFRGEPSTWVHMHATCTHAHTSHTYTRTHVNYKIYLKYENKVISMSELRAWRSTLIPAGGKQRQEALNSLEVRLGSTVSSRLPSYVGRLSLTNQRMQSETRVGLLLTENLQTISSNAPPSTERTVYFLILRCLSKAVHTALFLFSWSL